MTRVVRAIGCGLGTRALLSALLLPILSSLCLGGETPTLEARLAPLAKAHKGRVAIVVKHLITGETFVLNGDEVMATASLIKFPLMVEVYMLVHEGKLKLSDLVTLREKDKVPGSDSLGRWAKSVRLRRKDVYDDCAGANSV